MKTRLLLAGQSTKQKKNFVKENMMIFKNKQKEMDPCEEGKDVEDVVVTKKGKPEDGKENKIPKSKGKKSI